MAPTLEPPIPRATANRKTAIAVTMALTMHSMSGRRLWGLATIALLSVSPAAGAATASASVVYSFAGQDGSMPAGAPIQGSDGNFYGTTRYGGAAAVLGSSQSGYGVVYKLTAAGTETVLHSFGLTTSDGVGPSGPLVQAADGTLFGTTYGGGASGRGTVFKITTGGTYTQLYQFAAAPEGAVPVGLVIGPDSNLYGVTNMGGANDGGVFFKITPQGTYTNLYSFEAYGHPVTPPVVGTDGLFYGVLQSGGAYQHGVFYSITSAGIATTVYSFGTCSGDADSPRDVVFGADGDLYGVSWGNVKALFVVSPSGPEQSLKTANLEPLLLGNDNNFYTINNGTWSVVAVAPDGTTTNLYSFPSTTSTATGPFGRMVQASDGSFYGALAYGTGGSTEGAIYKLTASGVPAPAAPPAINSTCPAPASQTSTGAIQGSGLLLLLLAATSRGWTRRRLHKAA